MKIHGPLKISTKLITYMHNLKSNATLRYAQGCCRQSIRKGRKLNIAQEINGLIREYGDNYPVSILIRFNNTGLKSSMFASEIKVNEKFRYNKQEYTRIPNPFGPDVVDNKIGAIDSENEIIQILADQYVRPMLFGIMFETPDEIEDEFDLELKRDCVYSDIYSRIIEYIKDKSGMLDPLVSYSAYKSDENNMPQDNLDEVAVVGKVIFKDSDNYGYTSPIVENPTWLELCLLAEFMIRDTEDYHHIFLEGVYKTSEKMDGIPVYNFMMGS